MQCDSVCAQSRDLLARGPYHTCVLMAAMPGGPEGQGDSNRGVVLPVLVDGAADHLSGKFIATGANREFGGCREPNEFFDEVFEHVIRIEFQRRGALHIHGLRDRRCRSVGGAGS